MLNIYFTVYGFWIFVCQWQAGKNRHRFIDQVRIYARGGGGGQGHPKFGGIGGSGGDVYVQALPDETLKNVKSSKREQRYIAGPGDNSKWAFIPCPSIFSMIFQFPFPNFIVDIHLNIICCSIYQGDVSLIIQMIILISSLYWCIGMRWTNVHLSFEICSLLWASSNLKTQKHSFHFNFLTFSSLAIHNRDYVCLSSQERLNLNKSTGVDGSFLYYLMFLYDINVYFSILILMSVHFNF